MIDETLDFVEDILDVKIPEYQRKLAKAAMTDNMHTGYFVLSPGYGPFKNETNLRNAREAEVAAYKKGLIDGPWKVRVIRDRSLKTRNILGQLIGKAFVFVYPQ